MTCRCAAARLRCTLSRLRDDAFDFPPEGMTRVLVDDVLYTGRTIRAATFEALFSYGHREARACS